MGRFKSSVAVLALLTVTAACSVPREYPVDCLDQVTAFPWEQTASCPGDDSGS